jgi:GntR family transcriptional regulator / MocR family aminotransferase
MFPALRLAYVVLPEPLVDPFARALSLTARHLPVLTQAVLAHILVQGHFGRHIRRMRELYGERAQALEAAAQRDWTDLLQLTSIDAGLDTAARLAF